MNNFSARQNVVNTMVIIDTAYIVDTYPNPSKDFEDPTPIDSSAAYVIAVNGERLSGSSSYGVTLHAQPGDYINWFGVSESNNFKNEVIVYDTIFENKADVLSVPNFIQVGYTFIVPSVDYPESDPIEQEATAWYITAVALRQGEGTCSTQFALYTPGAKGGMELYGYFQWTVTIRLLTPQMPK